MLVFSAIREDFVNCVNRASQGLAGKPPGDIYAGMLFSGRSQRIVLTASDGDMTFTAETEARVESASAANMLIPGKVISEISRYFTGKEVSLDFRDEGTCQIKAGRSEFTLSATSGEKYPEWQDMPTPIGLLDAEEFADAVRKVIPAASRTDPVLRGVHLSPMDGKLYIVATDHARMAVMAPEWIRSKDESRDDVTPTLVSTAVLERFARAAGTDDHWGTMTLGWNSKIIGMGIPGLQVTSRLIAGEFPKVWKKIMDSAPENWVTFDPGELTRAVKMAALAADQGRIDLTFDGDDLNVTAQQQGRAFSDYVDTEGYSGDTVTIGFGAQVLIDSLNGCKGEGKISFSAPLKPVHLRSGSYSCMIQPRRDV